MKRFEKCPACNGFGRDIENTVDVLDRLGEVIDHRHPECEVCEGDGLGEEIL